MTSKYLGAKLVRLSVFHAGFNLPFQSFNTFFHAFLLVVVQIPDGEDLLDTTFTKHHLGCKVCTSLLHIRLDISAFNSPAPRKTTQNGLAKAGSSIRHRESCTAFAILGLDDVSASVLHVLIEVGNLVRIDLASVLVLGEERQDRGTSVASDNRDVDVARVLSSNLTHKLVSTNNIESANTDNLHWVEALF